MGLFRIEISCPSKTFLFGEYSVLDGAPACILATEPKFSSGLELSLTKIQLGFSDKTSHSDSKITYPLGRFHKVSEKFHPDSGVAKLLGSSFYSSRIGGFAGQFSLNLNRLDWLPPRQNTKGLGTSSAEILLGLVLVEVFEIFDEMNELASLESEEATFFSSMIQNISERVPERFRKNWPSVVQAFQQAQAVKGIRPSGADLLAQIFGYCSLYQPDKKQCEAFKWPFKKTGFLIYQTGFKLPTHTHLAVYKNLSEISGISELNVLSQKLASLMKKASDLIENSDLIEEWKNGPGVDQQEGRLRGAAREELAQAVLNIEKDFFSGLREFRRTLFKHGLELNQTSALIQKIESLLRERAGRESEKDGELWFGVKGAGALGADTIVIWLPKEVQNEIRLEIERACPNLTYVSSELELIPGFVISARNTRDMAQ
jgi:mevalonate kinase